MFEKSTPEGKWEEAPNMTYICKARLEKLVVGLPRFSWYNVQKNGKNILRHP
jgi:hypothetical protein